jgi:hypothetical protein
MNKVQRHYKPHRLRKKQVSVSVTFKKLTRPQILILFSGNVILQLQMAEATLQAIYLASGPSASLAFSTGGELSFLQGAGQLPNLFSL